MVGNTNPSSTKKSCKSLSVSPDYPLCWAACWAETKLRSGKRKKRFASFSRLAPRILAVKPVSGAPCRRRNGINKGWIWQEKGRGNNGLNFFDPLTWRLQPLRIHPGCCIPHSHIPSQGWPGWNKTARWYKFLTLGLFSFLIKEVSTKQKANNIILLSRKVWWPDFFFTKTFNAHPRTLLSHC